MAHFPMRWVVCLIFLLAQSCLFCSIAVVNLFVYCLCRIRADVSDLQCRESGWYPSSLCAPELRQPRSCSAQSVCCRRQTLLRGEALTQELPLRSLRLVCTAFNFSLVLSFPFLSSVVTYFLFYSLRFSFLSCIVLLCLAFVLCHAILFFLFFALFVSCIHSTRDFSLPPDRKTIFFNSHQVSKPESSSDLTAVSSASGIMRVYILITLYTCHVLLCETDHIQYEKMFPCFS